MQSAFTDEELPVVVREVALVAVRRSGRDTLKLSQRTWDDARPATKGFEQAPSARQVCTRINAHNKGQVRTLTWKDILELACTDKHDHAQVMAAQRRAPADAHIDDRHIFFALRRAAAHLGRDTLSPDQYAAARDELIAEAGRRRNGSVDLEELMPTKGQIVRRYDEDWAAALNEAGLDPFVPDFKRGMKWEQAIDLYVALAGEWPGKAQLERFAKRSGFSLQGVQHSAKPHREWVEEMKAARKAAGLPDLPGPFHSRPKAMGPEPEPKLDTGESGTIQRNKPPGYWTRERLIEAFITFHTHPDVAGNQARTTPVYDAFRTSHPDLDLPTLSAFVRGGGWGTIKAAALEQLRAAEAEEAA